MYNKFLMFHDCVVLFDSLYFYNDDSIYIGIIKDCKEIGYLYKSDFIGLDVTFTSPNNGKSKNVHFRLKGRL